jgi:SAM-dependent methyltransferase
MPNSAPVEAAFFQSPWPPRPRSRHTLAHGRGNATNHSRYIAPRLGGLSERLAWRVRQSIFQRMMATLQPTPAWRVLDVGVTSDRSRDSNFFERLYPHKASITAVGLEDASHLMADYPGLRFVQADALALPFLDGCFDLAFCSAVIEHVGSHQQQLRLIRELLRVARIVVLTTPDRFFPLEFHTLTPFLHWLPPRVFRRFLRLTGRSFFAEEAHLHLLDQSTLETLFAEAHCSSSSAHEQLLGLRSNLVYYLRAVDHWDGDQHRGE